MSEKEIKKVDKKGEEEISGGAKKENFDKEKLMKAIGLKSWPEFLMDAKGKKPEERS